MVADERIVTESGAFSGFPTTAGIRLMGESGLLRTSIAAAGWELAKQKVSLRIQEKCSWF